MITLREVIRHKTQQAQNLAGAVVRVVQQARRGGLKALYVGREVFKARHNVCLKCEYWSEGARLGLSKCRHAGCGCTRIKLHLKTEKCPLGKWEESL